MRRRLEREIEELIDRRLAERARPVQQTISVRIGNEPIPGEAIVSFDRRGRRIPRDPTNPQR